METIFSDLYQHAQPQDLVLWDIDLVLFQPDDPIHHAYKPTPALQKHWDQLISEVSAEEFTLLSSIVHQEAKTKLTHPLLPSMVSFLQKQNIPMMALTAIGTGEFGLIPQYQDFRLQELASFNLDFTATSLVSKELHFSGFPHAKKPIFRQGVDFPAGYPVVKNGVIFAAGNPKGQVLEKVLKLASQQPKTIHFIDDGLYNLQSVHAYCQKQKIGFRGFHYTGALPSPEETYCDQKMRNRLQHLKTFKRWLPHTHWLSKL